MKMANRIIRSGFLDSEKINALQDSEQLFFVRLMLVSDDYGLCDARPIFLRSRCYPVSEVSVDKVSKMLASLAENGLVRLYEADGKPYLEIINFGQRLRSMRYGFPCPPHDSHMSDACPPESEVEVETKKKIKILPASGRISKPAFKVAGQDIPGWLWGKILKYCNNDREIAARIFLRADQAKPGSVLRWIQAGIARGGYCWNSCALETDNPNEARRWIDENIYKIKNQENRPRRPDDLPEPLGDILRKII